ncbi:MFS transporter [Abyssisolibacter fermentans]|uniref:MFS transporter n=1 Tax=Abyssisolibacter fermentans TaxID=1766203 RepID=UPI00082C3106|nr:MFS transporter [Abyssisolibacter fermentans]
MDNKISLFKKYKWLMMITVLSFGTYAMYGLPYMKSVFYDPMRTALGLSHEQYGHVIGLYGKIALLMYFPGGWMADKFDPRKLMLFSYVSSGALGIYLSTYPSYAGVQFTFIAWGVTTILTFWAAQVKVTRSLGDDDMQGKIFGIANGIEGISGMIISFIALTIFNMVAVEELGLRFVLIFQSSLTIIVGFITFFALRDVKFKDSDDVKYTVHDYIKVLKMPEVWLIGIAIFSYYTVFSSLSYISPYLETEFMLSAAMVGTVSILRQTGTKIIGGPTFGTLADKCGSTSKMFIVGFTLVTVCVGAFMLIPVNTTYTILAVALMLLLAFGLFGLTGIGYATISESKIPMKYTGAAVGLISLIGYVPDAFYYNIAGNWLDTHGSKGYTYIFTLSLIMAVVGLAVSIILYSRNKKSKLDRQVNSSVK